MIKCGPHILPRLNQYLLWTPWRVCVYRILALKQLILFLKLLYFINTQCQIIYDSQYIKVIFSIET